MRSPAFVTQKPRMKTLFINWTEVQLREWVRCKLSAVYWAMNYVWIQEKETGYIIPFNMLPYRKRMLVDLQDGYDLVIDKCRRAGASWTMKTFAAWKMNFHPGSTILDLSRREDDAIDLLDKARFVLEHLAGHDDTDYELATKHAWMCGEFIIDNKKELALAWRDHEGRLTQTSKCDSLTTTTESGRSKGAGFIILDEWAFVKPDDIKTWRAIGSMRVRGTQYVKCSTPNGVGGDHYSAVMRARTAKQKGQLDRLSFRYHEVDWWDTEITREQYEVLIEDMDDDSIAQEFKREFLTSGSPAFSHAHVIAAYKPQDEYPEIAAALADYHDRVIKGEGDFYYAGGIDSMKGLITKKTNQKDWNSMTGFTRHRVPIQAFALHSKESISSWSGFPAVAGSGDIEWVVGTTTKKHEQYPGVYFVEDNSQGEQVMTNHQAPQDGVSKIMPWNTNVATKPKSVLDFQKALEGGLVIITDEFTFQCLMTYQDLGGGKYGAPSGVEFADDPVISTILSWQMILRMGAMQIVWPDFSTHRLTDVGVMPINRISRERNVGMGPITDEELDHIRGIDRLGLQDIEIPVAIPEEVIYEILEENPLGILAEGDYLKHDEEYPEKID